MCVQLIHQWGGLGVYPDVVVTPDGPLSLASTSWSYTEQWWTDRRTPGWVIVLGVAFGMTIVGLLFFMVTENRPRGSVTIHMRARAQDRDGISSCAPTRLRNEQR